MTKNMKKTTPATVKARDKSAPKVEAKVRSKAHARPKSKAKGKPASAKVAAPKPNGAPVGARSNGARPVETKAAAPIEVKARIASMPKIQAGPARPLGRPVGAAKGPGKVVAGPQAAEIAHEIANGVVRTLGKPVRKNGFSAGDYVVYPTHGVGRITGIEERSLAGASLNLLVVNFEKDRMTLRVPVNKVETSGMRKLSSRDKMRSALTVLKGRARVKRTMWSRRAQEYEAKINSGDPESIAEVVRDLHRTDDQREQSYSERQLYEAALDRLVRELAAVERIEPDKAIEHVNRQLKIA